MNPTAACRCLMSAIVRREKVGEISGLSIGAERIQILRTGIKSAQRPCRVVRLWQAPSISSGKLSALRQMLVMIGNSGQYLDKRKVVLGVNLLLQFSSRDCSH